MRRPLCLLALLLLPLVPGCDCGDDGPHYSQPLVGPDDPESPPDRPAERR